MGIGGGIEDHGAALLRAAWISSTRAPSLLVWAKRMEKPCASGPGLTGFLDLGQGGFAVNLRLAAPQQIEVGAVEDVDRQGLGIVWLFCHSLSVTMRRLKPYNRIPTERKTLKSTASWP